MTGVFGGQLGGIRLKFNRLDHDRQMQRERFEKLVELEKKSLRKKSSEKLSDDKGGDDYNDKKG